MGNLERYYKYIFDNFKYDDYFSFYELSFLLNFNFTYKPDFTYINEGYFIELRNNEFERLKLYNNLDLSDYQIYYNKNLLSNTALNNKIDLLFDFFNMKKPNKFFNQYIYNRFLMYRPMQHTSLIDEIHYKSVKNLNIRDFKTIIPLDNNLKFIYTAIVSRLNESVITQEPPFEFEFNEMLNRELFEYYKDKLNYDLIHGMYNSVYHYLTVDDSFINYADEQLNLHDLKLGLTIDNITAYLKNSSELFNAFIEETQTITETIIQDEDVTATQTHTKQAKTITKEITDDDETTANENNKSADYIINSTTDINNIDDLYSNKYSDKATQNKNTFTSSKNKTYNETLNDSGDNVENQDVTARDSETTKQHTSTFNKYKGIDIDIKTYQEIIKEIINIPNKMYDFLRLGIS